MKIQNKNMKTITFALLSCMAAASVSMSASKAHQPTSINTPSFGEVPTVLNVDTKGLDFYTMSHMQISDQELTDISKRMRTTPVADITAIEGLVVTQGLARQ